MSHINEALKKAQKEKDSIYKNYARIISTPSCPGSKKKKGPVLAVLMVAALLAVAVFSALRYGSVSTAVKADVKTDRTVAEKKIDRANIQTAAVKEEVAGKPAETLDLEGMYQKALSSQQTSDLKGAERLYRKILNNDPEFVFALNNLGVIYMNRERENDALRMFEKAIDLKGDYVDPYYNLACLYSKWGNAPRSLDYLKKAIQLNKSVKNWAKNDNDLANVSASAGFRELIK
jgi:tetratricopeptide (TPR) repeat protein